MQANMGTWSSQHWWAARIYEEVRVSGPGDVTGRCWAKRKPNTQGRSADVHMVSPTRRSPNIWQAGKRMIPRENTNSKRETHDDEEDAKVACGRCLG